MPTCPSCHRDQIRSSAFCEFCGAVLDRPASAAQPAPESGAPDDSRGVHVEATPPSASRAARQAASKPFVHETGDVGAYIVRRIVALFIDIVIVGGLIALLARAWVEHAAPGGTLTAAALAQLLMLAGAGLLVYRLLFEGFVGTTLGKLVVGLAVARRDGRGIGLARAFVRNVVLPLDLAFIGFLLAAITPGRRRIGDFLAGTVVTNTQIGVVAPIVGVLVLAAAGYGVLQYAGGAGEMQRLENDAARLIPFASPAPTPTSIATPSAAPSSRPMPTASPIALERK